MSRDPLPPELVRHFVEHRAGRFTPVEPRNAATVLLLRDGSDEGIEVYLLRRQLSMAFAGGACVFPGGGVDPRDFDEDVAWAGPSPHEWGRRLGAEPELAKALVCAAVRETFEEAGVLLAGPHGDDVVADTTGADWEADRQALERRDLSFTDFLSRRVLVLRSDLLGAWAAWLTPVVEPRRFRTWFFVASLPTGQRTRDVSTESDDVMWLSPGEAMDRVDSGELAMLAPTYINCLDLTRYADVAAVHTAARSRVLTMFEPTDVVHDGAHVLSLPDEFELMLQERERRR